VALADDAERCRPGAPPPPPPPSPSSPSSSAPYPWAADPLDVVLVAHKILMKTLVEDTDDPAAAAARPCPCSKTITVVVAGEEEHGEAYERGRGGVDAGLTGDAAVLLEGLGCKLRVLLVDPSPELRARGGGASAAKKKKEERDDKVKVDDDDGGGGGDSDEDGDLSPPPKQLKLPAALEALVDALPRGRGLVRIQRVAGAVGLSGALMEAPPPATTFWRGDLELARALSAGALSTGAGGRGDGEAPLAAAAAAAAPPLHPTLPKSESRIPVKVSRCVTAPENPRWLRMASRPGERGGARLGRVTEYRRRSPEPGEGAGGGLGEGRQQQHPRAAKAAKMDAMDEGAACLGPLFDAAGGESGAGGVCENDGNDENDDGAAASRRDGTRSLSPDAVAKEERTSCYRYGQELVPLSAADACNKLPAAAIERSMLLLGFASPPPLHAIAEGAWVLTAGGATPRPSRAKAAAAAAAAAAAGAGAGAGAGGSCAAEALSALVRAAARSRKVMVVRWVTRAGGSPRLFAGFPVLGEEVEEGDEGGRGAAASGAKEPGPGDEGATAGRRRAARRPRLSSPDCFVLVSLPFADDVRRVRFPALDADEARAPAAGQVAAARALVRAWDLRGSGLFARAAVDGSEGRPKRDEPGGGEGGERGAADAAAAAAAAAVVLGGAHPNPSRLRQLACAAAKAVAVIRAGGGGGGGATGAAAAGAGASSVPEVGRGPGTGLLEPPAWPAGSRADAAARRLAEAFASGP